MTWLSYIFPQTKLITSSKYNHLIRVNEEYGENKLLVNGSRQSGLYIRKLWQKALLDFGIIGPRLPELKQFQFRESQKNNILVLGVAGGTVIHMLHGLYPKAKITGIDIDKKMIDIGKKYFGLGEISGLSLVNSDALEFVHNAVRRKSKYDLIIVDLSFGRKIPEFVENKDFLLKIKSLLTDHGKVIINYLRELEYKEKSELLLKLLETVFVHVSDAQIARNRFFMAGE